MIIDKWTNKIWDKQISRTYSWCDQNNNYETEAKSNSTLDPLSHRRAQGIYNDRVVVLAASKPLQVHPVSVRDKQKCLWHYLLNLTIDIYYIEFKHINLHINLLFCIFILNKIRNQNK